MFSQGRIRLGRRVGSREQEGDEKSGQPAHESIVASAAARCDCLQSSPLLGWARPRLRTLLHLVDAFEHAGRQIGGRASLRSRRTGSSTATLRPTGARLRSGWLTSRRGPRTAGADAGGAGRVSAASLLSLTARLPAGPRRRPRARLQAGGGAGSEGAASCGAGGGGARRGRGRLALERESVSTRGREWGANLPRAERRAGRGGERAACRRRARPPQA